MVGCWTPWVFCRCNAWSDASIEYVSRKSPTPCKGDGCVGGAWFCQSCCCCSSETWDSWETLVRILGGYGGGRLTRLEFLRAGPGPPL